VRAAIPELVTQERLLFGHGGEGSQNAIVLIGRPSQCTGLLPVQNPQNTRIKLKAIWLKTSRPELVNTCEPEIVVARVNAKLCPGETQQVPIDLELRPGTPPGCYDACLESGEGRSCQVSVHVLENRQVELYPSSVTYGTQPGATFTVLTNVRNAGNVTTNIPKRVAVTIHALERGWQDHFHAAAKAEGDHGQDAFLDSFVKRMGRAELPLGRAKLLQGSGPLAPQSARLLELRVTLPKKLHLGRTYQAIVRLGEVVFTLTLPMTAAQPAPDPNPNVPR
jgi:hypothetical protein